MLFISLAEEIKHWLMRRYISALIFKEVTMSRSKVLLTSDKSLDKVLGHKLEKQRLDFLIHFEDGFLDAELA